jgi:hypothetical protein
MWCCLSRPPFLDPPRESPDRRNADLDAYRVGDEDGFLVVPRWEGKSAPGALVGYRVSTLRSTGHLSEAQTKSISYSEL